MVHLTIKYRIFFDEFLKGKHSISKKVSLEHCPNYLPENVGRKQGYRIGLSSADMSPLKNYW